MITVKEVQHTGLRFRFTGTQLLQAFFISLQILLTTTQIMQALPQFLQSLAILQIFQAKILPEKTVECFAGLFDALGILRTDTGQAGFVFFQLAQFRERGIQFEQQRLCLFVDRFQAKRRRTGGHFLRSVLSSSGTFVTLLQHSVQAALARVALMLRLFFPAMLHHYGTDGQLPRAPTSAAAPGQNPNGCKTSSKTPTTAKMPASTHKATGGAA